MRIALTHRFPWSTGVEVLGHSITELLAEKDSDVCSDLMSRASWGESASEAASASPPDMILDCDGEGLLFVPDPALLSDYQPLHERLGINLVSHLQLPLCEALGAMLWGHVWACLQSKTWRKFCADPAQVAELQAFGVPNVMFLPAAAPDADYSTTPLSASVDGPQIGCPAVSHGNFFDEPNQVESARLLPGIITSSAVASEAKATFFDTYFNLYAIEPRPEKDGDPAALAGTVQRYYAAKGYYTAQLGIARHARFVRFLRMRLADQLRLFGTIQADGSIVDNSSLQQRVEMYRSVAINLGLGFNRAEHAPDGRLFEIVAAGGFLLAHSATQITDYLEAGVECDVFTSESDLLEKIQHYLDNSKQRIAIAAAGQRRVLQSHLYSHRLTTILNQPALTCSATSIPQRSGTKDEPERDMDGSSSPASVAHGNDPPGRLLVLQNPGRMSRYWLEGIQRGARELGIQTRVLEMGDLWQRKDVSRQVIADRVVRLVRQERIIAAIGYTQNGCLDLPLTQDQAGQPRSLLESLGVPHLMFWSDHPQWANDRAGLLRDHQPLLKSPNNHHFLKSSTAADEIRDLLGWANVYGMTVAEDVERLKPKIGVDPDFDVVTIIGSPPSLDPDLEPFLDHDEPDVHAIYTIIAEKVASMLESVWEADAPPAVRPQLQKLGQQWLEARRRDPSLAAYRHFVVLSADHAEATAWLRQHYETYFRALEALWEFGRWQRTFVVRYLARFFRVGVFGKDWSAVGLGGDSGWVGYDDQPEVYARGKVALTVSQCSDEEGMAHKPFEITACGAACLHINRLGVADQFEPGVEIELFETPFEARRKVEMLLKDDDHRTRLAQAGRLRTQRDHTWSKRLSWMLQTAGLSPQRFGLADESQVREGDLPRRNPTPAPTCSPRA